MARKNLSAIGAIIRQKLQDESAGSSTAYTWEDDELDVFIGDCLREISEASPYMVREVLTTIANSRVLDVSDIEDLLYIDKAEYPIGSDPPDYRNVIELDAETVEIDTSLTPAAGGSSTLVGTVTFTHGSAAITGAATAFSTALSAGYLIKKSTGTRWYRVYSIESATALTLAEPCLETTGADTVNVTQYCYEAVYLFCAKLHQLTEETSTLTALLEKTAYPGCCWLCGYKQSSLTYQ